MKKLKLNKTHYGIAIGIIACISTSTAIIIADQLKPLENWEALLIGLLVFLIGLPVLKLMLPIKPDKSN